LKGAEFKKSLHIKLHYSLLQILLDKILSTHTANYKIWTAGGDEYKLLKCTVKENKKEKIRQLLHNFEKYGTLHMA
jgi:thiamine monophosphate kinase